MHGRNIYDGVRSLVFAGFEHSYCDIGVFGKSSGYDEAGRASSYHEEVILLLGEAFGVDGRHNVMGKKRLWVYVV